uniref:Claudin 4 n=1 Tax=Scleropages formosus TaxID=113540 RepID=A0A8C9RA86_SCLFO
MALQMLVIILAIIGWLGVIIMCALPVWKVTAFIGANIMQCKIYDSMLSLSQDLQAARALIVISIVAAFVGILLSIHMMMIIKRITVSAIKLKVRLATETKVNCIMLCIASRLGQ